MFYPPFTSFVIFIVTHLLLIDNDDSQKDYDYCQTSYEDSQKTKPLGTWF